MKLELGFKKEKLSFVLIILIILVATILRFYNVGRESLWLDEIGQYIVARNDIFSILRGVQTHLSPPLDYIIMHFLIKFTPQTELFIRASSAIFGIGSVLMIFLLGRRLFSKEIGIISAFLLAISPFAIKYSQEARMYSSFLFFSLFSFYTFILFISDENNEYNENNENNEYNEYNENNEYNEYNEYNETDRNKDKVLWTLWIFSGILLLYTHYFGLFVVLVQFTYFLIFFLNKKNIKGFISIKVFLLKSISGFFLIGMSFIIWLNIFWTQTQGGTRILWYGLKSDWVNFFVYPMLIFSGLFNNPNPNNLNFLINSIVLLLIFIIFAGIFYGIKRYRYGIFFLIIWIELPLIILYILTIIRGPVTTVRNLIFMLPAFQLILSLGILGISTYLQNLSKQSRLQEQSTIIKLSIVFVLLLIIMSITLPNISRYYGSKKEDWRGVGKYLTENADSKDKIIILGGPIKYLNFYYNGTARYYTPKNISEFVNDIIKSRNSTNCIYIFLSGHSHPLLGKNRKLIIDTLNKNATKIKIYSRRKDTGLYKVCK